jgi:hypothetical protein
MNDEPIIHTDVREMCRFLATLAEALDAAGRPTAEAFAEFYGHTGALGWVAGMLEDYAANPPIEIRVAPAAAIQALPAPGADRGGVQPQAGRDSSPVR